MKICKLRTEDKINIAINHYKNLNDEVVIIAPGWCMTKDAKVFMKISEMFAKNYDVITLDFRGHGKSGGMCTFTAKELMDIDAVVKYAIENDYKKINLVGFSLGAAVVLIYASQTDIINKVIAVSPPTAFNKIENKMWKKESWWETCKKFELNRFLSIRLCPIPLKKIKPIDVIDKIKIPTLFIAGEKDPTVCAWHTEELYKTATCTKEFKLFENGYHAEDLFLYFEEEFTNICLNWLKNSSNRV